jgi:transglutaminase-like putative cysteine protease
MDDMDKSYLLPTFIIDSDHEAVIAFAREAIDGAGEDPVAKAVKLYYAARDRIRYDPYYPFYLPEHYRASNVLKAGRGFCICKAAFLCALGRACGIPSRVGFATVRNHLTTRQLFELIGTDVFSYHGFTEFYLEGKWVKATPTFNAALCIIFKVPALEFNGHDDSLFHPYNREKKQFMEYLEFHGTYADIPVETIVAAWKQTYGKERIEKWIDELERSGGKSWRDFQSEEIWTGSS